MRRFLTIAIPIVSLIIFVLIMQSGRLLKESFSLDDDVKMIINTLKEEIDYEKWDEINQTVNDLDKAWKIVASRLQFSVEREQINDLSKNIARLKGAAKANDKANSLIELYEVENTWENIAE